MSWFYKKINISVLLLSIAILSLSLSTFQAEVSEANQTTREASFEMLKTLNHLQYIIDKEHYGKQNKERYLDGWSDIVFINDLAIFITPRVDKNAKKLLLLWKKDFENFGNRDINIELSKAIKDTKEGLKVAIRELK